MDGNILAREFIARLILEVDIDVVVSRRRNGWDSDGVGEVHNAGLEGRLAPVGQLGVLGEDRNAPAYIYKTRDWNEKRRVAEAVR